MKKYLPVFVLTILTAASAICQSKKYFAVTGDHFGSVNWIVFRQFDLDNISNPKTLYVPAETNEIVYDAYTSSPVAFADTTKGINTQACSCMNNRMVAAIAYDSNDDRLYYTTMLGNQLRYLDLNSNNPKSYAVTDQLLKNFPDQPGEASIITRMCFAANGFGYALTNDNNHLIQFSTKNDNKITDLGALVNSKTNGDHFVKEQYKAWGGDLIADANGSIYLFALQGGVFKINVTTRVATYLGNIQNLPVNYTINAAMIEGDSNVVVASSTDTLNYYSVDLTTLQATVVNTGVNHLYNVSDFANANLAFSIKVTPPPPPIPPVITDTKTRVTTYPNPVTTRSFTLQFNNFDKGIYSISLFGVNGKELIQKTLEITDNSQTQKINLPSPIVSGTYIVNVINSDGKKVYTDKIIIAN